MFFASCEVADRHGPAASRDARGGPDALGGEPDRLPVVAVVIPCFKVKAQIRGVLSRIGAEVSSIFVVDDASPDGCGRYVEESVADERVRVIHLEQNAGVGGAVKAGYRAAIAAGADIIVKVDGDGQMDPALIRKFVKPIIDGRADYTKGNRFYDIESTKSMPVIRIFGNAALSFAAKASSGYWNLFDPNNGYTAIHAGVARLLPLDKVDDRFFFESDMLFRLNIMQAVVFDIPITAIYGDEKSNLVIYREAFRFTRKHGRNMFKRIFYNYFLRGFSVASIELLIGIILFVFGFGTGAAAWVGSIASGVPATAGTVMLAGLPVIVGIQLFLNVVNYDMSQVPTLPAQCRLAIPLSSPAEV